MAVTVGLDPLGDGRTAPDLLLAVDDAQASMATTAPAPNARQELPAAACRKGCALNFSARLIGVGPPEMIRRT